MSSFGDRSAGRVRTEARSTVTPSLAIPLVAGALLGACSSEAQPAGNVAVAPAAPKAPSPIEVAQGLVRQRLGGDQALSFTDARTFDSEGAIIVCGRVARAGQGPQRYIAVGADDLFVEGEMAPGHMDRAVAEYCRNA